MSANQYRKAAINVALIVFWAVASVALASDKAESLIPFDDLDAAARARMSEVIPGYTFYRKVVLQRTQVHACTAVFEYIADHVDETTSVALPLKLAESRSRRLPNGAYYGSNGKGAVGYLWPLYAAPGKRVYLGQGSDREGKNVSGKAIVVLLYHETKPGNLELEVHAFVKVNGWFKMVLSKIFLPLAVGTVDKRFVEVLHIGVSVAEIIQSDPNKILATIDSLSSEDRAMLQNFRNLVITRDPASSNSDREMPVARLQTSLSHDAPP